MVDKDIGKASPGTGKDKLKKDTGNKSGKGKLKARIVEEITKNILDGPVEPLGYSKGKYVKD